MGHHAEAEGEVTSMGHHAEAQGAVPPMGHHAEAEGVVPPTDTHAEDEGQFGGDVTPSLPTPSWSEQQDFPWDVLQSTTSFLDLLSGQYTQDPASAISAQSAGQPSSSVLPSSYPTSEDPSAWYMQGRYSGTYSFRGGSYRDG